MILNHIAALYYSDLEQSLHHLPELTPDHVNLTSFSKMKINLAAQVLSNIVSLALQWHYASGEAGQTARFYGMMNEFFDCLNSRSTTEHARKRNNFLVPYSKVNDEHFEWLQNSSLSYFAKWYKTTQERPANISKDDQAKMFISQQTYRGLRITVHALLQVTKFPISERLEFVLSERFCQDLLEEYFWHQGARGHYGDNPTVQSFGYDYLTIAAPVVRGNVLGRHKGESSNWFVVSDQPLPKRKCK